MLRLLAIAITICSVALASMPSRSADLIAAHSVATVAAPTSGSAAFDQSAGYLNATSIRMANRPDLKQSFASASLDDLAIGNAPVPPAQGWLATNLPGRWTAPSSVVFHSPTDLSSWHLGGYVGIGNADTLVHLITTPWVSAPFYSPIYIIAANFIYSAIEVPNVPLVIELEMDVVQHFGSGSVQQFNYDVGFKHNGPLYYASQSFQEFDIGPAFRWKWFPWNDYLYTNLRLIPFGFSYNNALSQWEALQTELGQTAHVLNFLVAELTFAPSPASKWEAFVRVHHRSGINGLVNGVTGGANYVSTGARVSF
jgi:hypothetical protein